jgi:hypothetical protein
MAEEGRGLGQVNPVNKFNIQDCRRHAVFLKPEETAGHHRPGPEEHPVIGNGLVVHVEEHHAAYPLPPGTPPEEQVVDPLFQGAQDAGDIQEGENHPRGMAGFKVGRRGLACPGVHPGAVPPR